VGEWGGGVDEVEEGRCESGDGDAGFLKGAEERIFSEIGEGGGTAEGEHGG
jgi:hypothetical protein